MKAEDGHLCILALLIPNGIRAISKLNVAIDRRRKRAFDFIAALN